MSAMERKWEWARSAGTSPAFPNVRCDWHQGCELEAMPDESLCDFHFDACERPEHHDAQLAYELLRAQRVHSPEAA